MPRQPFKNTIALLEREFAGIIATADREIPTLEESLKIIPPEFGFHKQIQDHINVLVDARLRARHYLSIIAGNAEPEPDRSAEPPSPEEPSSGGAE